MTDAVTIAIIAGLSAGIPGIVGSVLGLINRVGIDRVTKTAAETHNLVNSRMTELLDLTRKLGKVEGAKEESDRAEKA